MPLSPLFSGPFETHITFAAPSPEEVERLASWSRARGWKFVHIELARGYSASQPMITFHSRGTLPGELERAQGIAREAEAKGLHVARLKLEVSSDHPDVLATAGRSEPTNYFEHHIKLLLGSADLTALENAVTPHGAHLSRNARRVRDDGQEERFVTQRCYGAAPGEAKAALEALRNIVNAFSFPVLETEEEYVVFDSNLALDAGWLENSAR